MGSDALGQRVTFSTYIDPDERYTSFVWTKATRAQDTIRKIVAARGRPDLRTTVAQLNGIRSIDQKLRPGRPIRLPGTLVQGFSFECHFQDMKGPIVKDGYAVFDAVDRYGELGITHFKGYNPMWMDLPIIFEGWDAGYGASQTIEQKISILERMAGRGYEYKGSAQGPPAIIRIATLDNRGNVVPLIPANYQWTVNNPNAPLWRINGIAWDEGALVDSGGRVRVSGTVSVWEYTPLSLATTLTQRAKAQGF